MWFAERTRISDHVRVLTIRDSAGREQTLRTTDDHPFFIVDEGWANAAKLLPGDRLLEAEGAWSELMASVREEHPEGVAVFNFRVGGMHTYFVRAEHSGAAPVWVHNASREYLAGDYRHLDSSMKPRNGRQPNHLNQDAVYGRPATITGARGSVIPYLEGATVAVRGSTAQWNSQHNRFHRALERFWNGARTRFDAFGIRPTNAEYGEALYRALRKDGFDAKSAYRLADSARRQRIRYGHLDHLPVPNIPNPFPRRFLPGGDL